MKTIRISDAEWEVMDLLWERSPRATGEIVELLGAQSGWKPRTIRTLLERLAQKGALKVLEDGRREFVPAVSRQACVRQESRSFVQKVFRGEPASFLLHLIKETKLSREEIDQLKQLLSEKEK
jgi:BlaI family penicillinase repressor